MDNDTLKIAIPAPVADVPNYLSALKALGAEPVLADAGCDADRFDGLLLPGGGDIDPRRYGQKNIASCPPDPELDARQFAVMDAFAKLGKPVFGICRGHQLINVYFGGTLIQHIACAERHSRDAGAVTDKVHDNICMEGSFIARLYGARLRTNSSHHQAVDRPGENLRIAMRSDDGIAEAMYHEKLPVWSVQWHPERMCFGFRSDDYADGGIILKWFLDRCAAARLR